MRAEIEQEERLAEIAEWVKDTCLLFGCDSSTAFEVGGLFVRGLKAEWAKAEAPLELENRAELED